MGQFIGTAFVITYYTSLIALTIYYFVASFSTNLPWSRCLESWGPNCVDSLAVHKNVTKLLGSSGNETQIARNEHAVSSSEMYFMYVYIIIICVLK